MKQTFAALSLLLFGLSVVFLFAWTAGESVFAGMSSVLERIITFAMLVLPAAIGAVLGVMSLRRREGRNRMAVAGILLNTLFALFHMLIVFFAG